MTGVIRAHVVLCRLPRPGVVGAMRDASLFSEVHRHQGAGRLVEGADREQHAPHVGMHDDRIGTACPSNLAPVSARPFQPVLGAYGDAFW